MDRAARPPLVAALCVLAVVIVVALGSCLVYLSAANVLVSGARLWLRPTQTATVSYHAQIFELPLPTASTLEAEGEGFARYLAVGDPTFDESLAPFEYLDQMGSEYLFVSDELRLSITTSKRTRYFTQVELRLSPRAAKTDAAPRAQTERGAAGSRRSGETRG